MLPLASAFIASLLLFGLVLPLAAGVYFFLHLIVICGPNHVLVLSGRSHVWPDGVMRGYRVIKGGRAVRLPLLEECRRLDLQVPVELELRGDEDGARISCALKAALRIRPESPHLERAVERFLGVPAGDVRAAAADALEPHLHAVIGEELAAFAALAESERLKRVSQASQPDLDALGFELLGLEVGEVRAV